MIRVVSVSLVPDMLELRPITSHRGATVISAMGPDAAPRARFTSIWTADNPAGSPDIMIGTLTDLQIDRLLREERLARLGCADGDRVYVVPVSYAYEGGAVYGHTREGSSCA